MTDSTKKDQLWLSVVLPAYDEEGSLAHMCERLEEVLLPLATSKNKDFEIIIVDDGSKDGTWKVIEAESEKYTWLRGVRLARNFGHQPAIAAGMNLAKGQAIITMDADLQHPPEVLPELISAWEEGAAVVITKRLSATDTSFFKASTSFLFYKIFSMLTEVNITPGTSDFRLLSRPAYEYMVQLQDASLFFRGAVSWLDYRDTKIIEFQAAERFAGQTSYTFKKMFQMASQSMLSFSVRPLKIGIWIGVLTSVISFIELGYILAVFLGGKTIPGWASTLGILTLFFGILFIVLGILGLYIANIYKLLQNRPHFIVAQDTRVPIRFNVTQEP